jgi:small G protein signaling modulator 3
MAASAQTFPNSPQLSTPVHSHPLSPDEIVPNNARSGRRSRPRRSDAVEPSTSAATTGYFTPRPEHDPPPPGGASDWDGSVRRISDAHRRPALPLGGSLSRVQSSTSSLNLAPPSFTEPRASRAPPLLVVDASDASVVPHTTLAPLAFPDGGVPDARAAQILGTRWHEYSDSAIQAAVARLDTSDSPADVPIQPYHEALRVLSAAVHSLSRARIDLEEKRRRLEEREKERKERAKTLMEEMNAADREIAKRVLQSLFPDDDEGVHRVQRKHSHQVCLPSSSEDHVLTNFSLSPSHL